MFGFDVLVDSELKPHLMEVNFAPSLNTDSALDLKVKSKVRVREEDGVYSFVACLHHNMIIGYSSLSRRRRGRGSIIFTTFVHDGWRELYFNNV